MSTTSFNHVLLCARTTTKEIQQTIEWTQQQLEDLNIQTTVQTQPTTPPLSTTGSHNKPFDLILVVGGDGSLLHAAQTALYYDIPIIGIYRGQLGFLTDLPPHDKPALESILRGKFIIQERSFLNVDFFSDNQQHTEYALNDAVLLPGDSIHMIKFDTFINEQLIYKNRASGMIVSTPTGSTAYSLSAGGPILHPTLDALSLIPMFPHTLSSRPLVIEGNSTIQIKLNNSDQLPPILTCDGREKKYLDIGSSVTIHRHHKRLQLLHPENYHYFDRLHEKLGWENRHKRM